VIVARKTAKNGKNNSDKRSRRRTSTTSNNRRSSLKEPREKWKGKESQTKLNGTTLIKAAIPPAQLMKTGIVEEGIVIVPGIPVVVVPPHRSRISITSKFLKNRSTCRLRN
jgi:hypothetical protein